MRCLPDYEPGHFLDAELDAYTAELVADMRDSDPMPEDSAWPFDTIEVHPIIGQAQPAPRFALPTLRIGTVSVLGAHPGVGKSGVSVLRHLQAAMGYDITAPGASIDAGGVDPIPSLLITLEDDLADVVGRLQAAALYYDIPAKSPEWENLHLVTAEELNWPPLTESNIDNAMGALSAVIQRTGAKLVTIDPLNDLGVVEDNESFSWLLAGLIRVAREADCHIVLTHHFRKGAPGQPEEASMEQFRGGGVLLAKVRHAVTLSATDDGVIETIVKSNHGPRGATAWALAIMPALNGCDYPVLVRDARPADPLDVYSADQLTEALNAALALPEEQRRIGKQAKGLGLVRESRWRLHWGRNPSAQAGNAPAMPERSP